MPAAPSPRGWTCGPFAVPCAAALLLFGTVAGQGPDRPGEPTPPSPGLPLAKKPELFRLSNEDLLKQARTLLRRSEENFRAEVRGLATVETRLEEARAATAKVEIPEKLPGVPVNGKSTEGAEAKAAMAFAVARMEAGRRLLHGLEKEKSLLESLASRVESADSAALTLANALDELGGFVLEISLRRQDGTLDAIPADLTSMTVAKKKDGLHAEQMRLRQRAQAGRKELEEQARKIEKARRDLARVEAEHALAARKHGRETRRKETERQYRDQDFGRLTERLRVLREEEPGLRGTFDLALSGFRSQAGKVEVLRNELKELKKPEAKLPAVERAEDVDLAVRATRAALKHSRGRIDRLRKIGAALEEMIRRGSACEGDAAVLEEHLYKMQVLAGVLKGRAAKDPKSVLPKELAALDPPGAIRTLNETVSEVAGATRNARKELLDLQARIEQTQAGIREEETRLAGLRQTLEATRQVLQWEEKLRAASSEKVLESFQATDRRIREILQRLPGEKSAFLEARKALDTARGRLDSLKDPFYRESEKEMPGELAKIRNELRKYAGMERSGKNGDAPPGMVGNAAPTQTVPKPSTAAEGARGKKNGDSSGLANFQQILSTWARIVDEQAEKKKIVLQAHDDLKKQMDRLAASLGEAHLAALQQHATAIDLKKRLGRGDLTTEKIPPGVTDALKRDQIARLEAEATALLVAREPLQEERDRLLQPQKELDEVRRLARDILGHIGKRLDLNEELSRLEEESRKEQDQLSESETKRIEQAAAERQAEDDSILDILLGIDTSPAAQRLTALLQTYYRELVELNERGDSLQTQKAKVESLLEAAQKEQAEVARILPVLKDLAEREGARREEDYLLIRARLRPEEADELLKGHQARTGRLLNKPLPAPEKVRAALAEQAAEDLYEADLRLEALRRWNRLFTQRLSPAGIDAEMGRYQDRLGSLNASRSALGRRVRFLTGRDAEMAGKEPAEAETRGVGEIDRVRQERFRVRRDGVVRIVVKIVVVLFLAFLLPRLAGRLLGRFSRREGVTTHGQLVYSFIRAFTRLLVWIAALVVILSTLGFDITAILAALGIGGLAIGLAAQETIADIIGGILIFIERSFSIGDTIVIGEAEPARVTGLTWRATRMRTATGANLTVPNREVMKANIRNLTEDGLTYDSVELPLPVNLSVERVLAVLNQSVTDCPALASKGTRGVIAPELELGETEAFVRYTPWWHVEDFDRLNAIRAEVLSHIWEGLHAAGLLADSTKS